MFAPPTCIGNTTADKTNFADKGKGKKRRRDAKRQWRTKNVSTNSNQSSSVSHSRMAQSKSTSWRACRNIWRKEWQCTIVYSIVPTISKRTHLSFRLPLGADG